MQQPKALPKPATSRPVGTRIEMPWENIDKFIADAREFMKILLLARSPTVKDWSAELYQSGVRWAQYFEEVLDRMPEENDAQLNPRLSALVLEFPELRLKVVDCALLASARHAFLRTLLENPFLPPMGLKFVVNGYLDIPVEEDAVDKPKQVFRKNFMRRAQLQSYVNSLRSLIGIAFTRLKPKMIKEAHFEVEILVGVPQIEDEEMASPRGFLLDCSYPLSLPAIKRKAYAKLLRTEFERLASDPEQLSLLQKKISSLLRPRKAALGATLESAESVMVSLREQLWWLLIVSSSAATVVKSSRSAHTASQSLPPNGMCEASLCEWILSKCNDPEIRLLDGVSPWLMAEVANRHHVIAEAYAAHLLLRTQKLSFPSLGEPAILDETQLTEKRDLELRWAYLINHGPQLQSFCRKVLAQTSNYLVVHSRLSESDRPAAEENFELYSDTMHV